MKPLTQLGRCKHSRLIFCCLTIGLFAACADIDEKSKSKPIEQTADTTSTQPLDALVDQGFYGESESETKDPDKITTISKEPGKLVEDLGFSGAEPAEEQAPKEKNFCLDANSLNETVALELNCKSISDRLASVTSQSCTTANLKTTGCSSVNGFPILVSEFAPLKNKQALGRILVIGGTHGDELTSVSVVFRWIEKLNRYHSGLFHWHIVPMMNPDGVLNKAASRTNQNGIDLNRNMPSDDWEENAISYWKTRHGEDPRRFPGNVPASEPETQWLIDEINTFQPDAIISVHAPYGVVDFDSLLLNTAPKSLGRLRLNLLGTYPGSLGNYAGINRNIPVITLELPHAWEMPPESETTKIWEDIVSWLRENIDDNLTESAGSTNKLETDG